MINILTHFIELCKDVYGCNVMQRCYENGSRKEKKTIMEILLKHIELVSDEHANYFVQFMMSSGGDVREIFDRIENNIIELSLNKSSSNVVEKCVEYGDDHIKKAIIDIFIKSNSFHKIVEHEFSNYVIQSLLKHTKPGIKQQLVNEIEYCLYYL